MDFDLFLVPLREVTEPIDRIINCVLALVNSIFRINSNGTINQSGWMSLLLTTIRDNPYLLIALSLVVCGFVIGLLKRLISV